MTYNISRLTLYAILSAVEEDLRELVVAHLVDQFPTADLLGAELVNSARERLARDGAGADPEDAADLLDYTDFGDLISILNTRRAALPAAVAEFVRSQTPAFERLIPVRNRVAHSRPLQIDDLATTLDIARDLAVGSDDHWPNLRDTLDRLNADSSFVLGLRIPAYKIDTDRPNNLPTPDFDETGFLGRRQDVAQLIKLCRGPYPVITIVGEGGLGKTALALKVAHDLLEAKDCPFEMVVWTTAKTTQLTAQEIIRIKGAICDSLGVLSSVATHLAGKSSEDPAQEIIQYMGAFKILLIIDNLETVLDDRIRAFLENLPHGSKVLMTSRVGLGALEFPFKLKGMDQGDAIQLVRALARVRQLNDLVRMPNPALAGYLTKLHMNPGFIKWFVSAVQTGRRPEEVLVRPDLFLNFCMSNVYSYLGEESRGVLTAMLHVGGRQSMAALAFLAEMNTEEVQRGLQQLLATNMVNMTSLPRGSSFETQYDISELARAYLLKHHPVEQDRGARLTARRNQLVHASEHLRAEHIKNPYAILSVAMRSDQDVIVAKYLRDALNFAFKQDDARADEMLARAKELAPEFFEVHRVEAVINARLGNVAAAREAYEAAVELEPTAPALRYFYGGFLMRYMHDVQAAVGHLRKAHELDPSAANIQIELARASLYALEFDATRASIDSLLGRADLSVHESRKAYNLHLQYFCRLADHRLSLHDHISALETLEHLRDAFQACPARLLDLKQWEVLERALPTARRCLANLGQATFNGRAQAVLDWLAEAPHKASGANIQGVVYRLNKDAGYGYVLLDDKSEIRFERPALREPQRWLQLSTGAAVTFTVERERGRQPRIVNLHWPDAIRPRG